MSGVGDGGFSGITPCLRRMSFLQRTRLALADDTNTLSFASYHSVSALGSSTGTLIGVSISSCSVVPKQIHNRDSRELM